MTSFRGGDWRLAGAVVVVEGVGMGGGGAKEVCVYKSVQGCVCVCVCVCVGVALGGCRWG